MNAIDVKEKSGSFGRHEMDFCHVVESLFILASFSSDGEGADGIDKEVESGTRWRVKVKANWWLVFVFDLRASIKILK